MGSVSRHRVLIGCVGYRNLRDLSFGPELLDTLRAADWPDGVEVDDLSPGGAIAVVHRLREAPQYDRVVLVGAAHRGDPPGRVSCYRWNGVLPPSDDVQDRVAEAVTGVVALDTLAIVGGHFGIWPALVMVEVEPADDGWGPGLSPDVERAVPVAIAAVGRAVHVALDQLPALPVPRQPPPRPDGFVSRFGAFDVSVRSAGTHR